MTQMTLREQLESALKIAMKERDATSRDTIRYTLSALKNAEIDQSGPLSDGEGLALLQREAKRRQDSIDQFRDAGRDDLVEREESQLAVLQQFLPAAMSQDDIDALVREVISETGAEGPAGLGKVMPIAIERAGGRADGKQLSESARRQLTSGS